MTETTPSQPDVNPDDTTFSAEPKSLDEEFATGDTSSSDPKERLHKAAAAQNRGQVEAASVKAETAKAEDQAGAVQSAPKPMPDDAPVSGQMKPKQDSQESQEATVSKSDMREYRRGRADGLVGIFTLFALLLLFGAYCWWKSYSPINPPQQFYVVFNDVASLNYQAAVFVHGVRVGSVDDIKIRDKEDDVLVRMKVNTQKCKIPEGSRFIILPNGVVGAKYIEIMLPERKKGKAPVFLTEKSIAVGDEPIRPEIVVNELVEKLGSLDFSRMQDKLVESLNKVGLVADHVSVLSNKMVPVAEHATATADSVNALAQEMRAPVNQMHQILDQKHPLMHMMFGRPGHLKDKDKTDVVQTSDGKGNTTTTTTTETKPKKKKHHFLGL